MRGLPREELTRAYTKLSQQYTTEVERATDFQHRIQSLQNTMIQHNESERQYHQLEQEHAAHCLQVQKTQERGMRAAQFEATAQQQVEVIVCLEELIGRHRGARINPSTSVGSEAYQGLTQTNMALRKEVRRGQNAVGPPPGSGNTPLGFVGVHFFSLVVLFGGTKPLMRVSLPYRLGMAAYDPGSKDRNSDLQIEYQRLVERSGALRSALLLAPQESNSHPAQSVEQLELLMRKERAEEKTIILSRELASIQKVRIRRVGNTAGSSMPFKLAVCLKQFFFLKCHEQEKADLNGRIRAAVARSSFLPGTPPPNPIGTLSSDII